MELSKAHQKKFAKFIELCKQIKQNWPGVDHVIIHHPAVLGDNYEEIITNLDLLAESELKLLIVLPSEKIGFKAQSD